MLRAWAAILRAVPRSRLVLKNKPFACEVARAQYWRAFEEEGVEATRVRGGGGAGAGAAL